MGHILLQKLGFKQRPIRSDDMPQGFLDASDASLCAEAHDLDNYLPPSQNINLLKWRRGINSNGINDPPTPVGPIYSHADFSQFIFPKKLHDNRRSIDDPKTTKVIHAEVASVQEALSDVDLLVTWKYITRTSAYLDYMIIRLNDEVVDCQLDRQYGGFMYYDNQATALQEVIERCGVYVAFNDEVTKVHSFFLKHGVRVYQEVKTDDGPRYKYLGDYFIHRTQKSLHHTDWALLNEEVKEKIVMRYANTSVTGPDDPCPGSKFSLANVRKWYDAHDNLPLVILHPTGRTFSEPTRPSLPFEASVAKQGAQPQVKSFMNMGGSAGSADERSIIAVSDIQERVLEYARASGMVSPDLSEEKDAAADSTSLDVTTYYTRDYEEMGFASRHVYTARALRAVIGNNDESYKATRQSLFELSGNRTRTGWEYSKILQALDDIVFGQVPDIVNYVEQEEENAMFPNSEQERDLEAKYDSEGSGGTERVAYPAPSGPPPPGYF
ncbi:hypothetical protein BDZ94DRAFT_1297129 [Collybia nuda]|uniref:Uncharacterized protein n=1 Tax=Collybia nuda TaxID=64659 RepID=A0A9P5Y9I2_9AGAR|nr:hypothetical protein BDZ94DRAFT_1297129 [Collybia nuda]